MAESESGDGFGCGRLVEIAINTLFPRLEYGGTKILSQYDSRKFSRGRDLIAKKMKYQWTYNGGIARTPMIADLPQPEERVRLIWILQVFSLLNRVSENTEAIEILKNDEDDVEIAISQGLLNAQQKILTECNGMESKSQISMMVHQVAGAISCLGRADIGSLLQEYKDLFQIIRLPKVAVFEEFLTDEIFAWYRVAGPNPMRIKLLGDPNTEFPDLTDRIFTGINLFEHDSIETAAQEKRLYYVEYSELYGIKTKPGRYICAPKAVFAVPKNASYRQQLMPIAIRCGPDSQHKLFSANKNHTEDAAWLAAKVTVQSSDSVDHEVVQHLSRTHLMCGIFVGATHRNISQRHPLFDLIHSHCYGTIFVNFLAAEFLVNEGGVVDYLTAPLIEETCKLVEASITSDSLSFNDWAPDIDLEKRQVISDVLHFPYRDDALKLWNATVSWVRTYIETYYSNDIEVMNDIEIQKWAYEISSKGKIPDFGDVGNGKIHSIDYLVRSVSIFIFAASSQHAATNFPQSHLMSYAPVMPLSLYAPPPGHDVEYQTIEDVILRMLPPISEANQQLDTASLLSGIRISKLGQYDNLNLKSSTQDLTIISALEIFRSELEEIETSITARNKVETKNNLPIYKFLRPSEISESINI